MEEKEKKKKAVGSRIKNPDYFFRMNRTVKVKDPKTGEFVRDEKGNIKTKTILGRLHPARYNRNIDSYDIMIQGQYYGTIHVTTDTKQKKILEKVKAKYPCLQNVPDGVIELKFNMRIA